MAVWGDDDRARLPVALSLLDGGMPENAPSECRILVVDDDRAIRQALSELLEDEGYQVVGARHGQDALAILNAMPAPNLILLDLNMPVMDGFAFRAAQQADPDLQAIPVAVISAGERATSAARLNAAAFIPKPFDFDLLLQTVEDLCA